MLENRNIRHENQALESLLSFSAFSSSSAEIHLDEDSEVFGLRKQDQMRNWRELYISCSTVLVNWVAPTSGTYLKRSFSVITTHCAQSIQTDFSRETAPIEKKMGVMRLAYTMFEYSDNSCLHFGEAENLRLNDSSVSTWYQKIGELLENHWSSVHIGSLKLGPGVKKEHLYHRNRFPRDFEGCWKEMRRAREMQHFATMQQDLASSNNNVFGFAAQDHMTKVGTTHRGSGSSPISVTHQENTSQTWTRTNLLSSAIQLRFPPPRDLCVNCHPLQKEAFLIGLIHARIYRYNGTCCTLLHYGSYPVGMELQDRYLIDFSMLYDSEFQDAFSAWIMAMF
ncbi:hypothetical protein STEG23_035827, partial [Scotinomys teguina]